jgi:hypothetical protein
VVEERDRARVLDSVPDEDVLRQMHRFQRYNRVLDDVLSKVEDAIRRPEDRGRRE